MSISQRRNGETPALVEPSPNSSRRDAVSRLPGDGAPGRLRERGDG